MCSQVTVPRDRLRRFENSKEGSGQLCGGVAFGLGLEGWLGSRR